MKRMRLLLAGSVVAAGVSFALLGYGIMRNGSDAKPPIVSAVLAVGAIIGLWVSRRMSRCKEGSD